MVDSNGWCAAENNSFFLVIPIYPQFQVSIYISSYTGKPVANWNQAGEHNEVLYSPDNLPR